MNRRLAFIRLADVQGRLVIYSLDDLLKLVGALAEAEPEMVMTIAWRPVLDDEYREIRSDAVTLAEGATLRPLPPTCNSIADRTSHKRRAYYERSTWNRKR